MTTTTTSTVITFPKCSMELIPDQELINNLIVATEAQGMVDNLDNNWFGQTIARAQRAGRGCKTFDEASKVVGSVLDELKKNVMKELDVRAVAIKNGTESEDNKNEALVRIGASRAKIDNSLKTAKSILVNSTKLGDTILKVVTDGGHVLFRKDGTPRGKTELQNLIKKAKAFDAPDASDMEKALHAAALLARRMTVLTDEERKVVMTTLKSKLKEMDEEREETEEVEDKDVAKAA